MYFKLICCEVFVREACYAIALSPHVVDVDFTPKGAHEKSQYLKALIQDKINESDGQGYDAILLGFGLCGNSTSGIRAGNTPLIIPRAHDCCTIFLGSRERFIEHFKDRLSAEWSSAGYLERGDSKVREADVSSTLGLDKSFQELVDKYGQDNAKYIWETLHPDMGNDEMIFIEVPEFSHLGYRGKMEDEAREMGKELKVIQGDMRLIKALVFGQWTDEEFLTIQPGQSIYPLYDTKRVFKAR